MWKAMRTYIAIDLKSFYASVECVARKCDPLTTNLVVADASRTDKTICLAVSPGLKGYGVPGRPRLFEVVRMVKEINSRRYGEAARLKLLKKGEDGKYDFASYSYNTEALSSDPSLGLTYIVAPPRMRLYEKISTQVFSVYKKYVSPDDIHVYSIDECFIDVTDYLNTYSLSAHELALTMIKEVLYLTGITATAGIGTNMYLAKIAMDIVAKHVEADKDGVRIAELDEKSYREKLWCHKPLTDFWRCGRGIAARMNALGCYTMGDIARLSVTNEDLLYKALGINAELLIDHAWGWEPTEISTIKSYRPETTSLSSGQVLSEPYSMEKARLIVREMTELMVLDLVKKGLVTRQVVLTLGYDRESIKSDGHGGYIVSTTGAPYRGTVGTDFYGRACPKYAHGTGNIDRWTSSTRRITEVMMQVFDEISDPDLLVRRVTVVAANLLREDRAPSDIPVQKDLFTDYEALERKKKEEDELDEKERRVQKAAILLQQKFGKNTILKGMNLEEGGTTIERNAQIGGHRAGED
ncbi:MAG: DNA methylase [Sphaerochaetaceae bacterium]|nr:DNA methylase [Sphaerochaetaceae bacterium]